MGFYVLEVETQPISLYLFHRFYHWCFCRLVELKGDRYLGLLVLAEVYVVGDRALAPKVEHEVVQNQPRPKGDVVPIPVVTHIKIERIELPKRNFT